MKPRILLYDIESSGLKGDFANCFCFGYLWHGEKHGHVVSMLDVDKPCRRCRRLDTAKDAALMPKVHQILSSADMWVTWYGKGFDTKFLNTRFLDAGLRPLPDVPHVDLYWTARSNLALTSNRLANVQEFLQLKAEKTRLTKRTWRRAQAGHVEELRYIIDHCRKDVEVLDQAYVKLRPYVRQHPRVTGTIDRCRVCGGQHESKGLRMTTTLGKRQRLQCNDCGHCETRRAA